MPGYDIIGDVHGCATQLDDLLSQLGYQRNDWTGAHWHPQRRAIFVGDLIDGGPEQLQTLEMVKPMADAGSAQVVMGNHEFNAIGYATTHPAQSGRYLRPHTDKNERQHRRFLKQLTAAQREQYLDWFKTLPLWLDLGDLRVVHACWHQPSMNLVERELGWNRFNALSQFTRACTPGDPLYDAIEILLKGPEISLVDHGQPAYLDKNGHPRDRARIRWWHPGATTLRDIVQMDGDVTTADGSNYPELPDVDVDAQSYLYTATVPVFYGHYWRTGHPTSPRDYHTHTACVDFSAVRGGTLMAYRWSGERQIRAENFLSCVKR